MAIMSAVLTGPAHNNETSLDSPSLGRDDQDSTGLGSTRFPEGLRGQLRRDRQDRWRLFAKI